MGLLTITAMIMMSLTAQAPNEPSPKSDSSSSEFQPDTTWKSLGKDIWFDKAQKRLVLRATVSQKEGPLEHLLCLKGTKEHEAILATEAPAKMIQSGLLLTGAEPGHPVRYDPKFEPPMGSKIKIEVEWVEKGQKKKALAKTWVMDLNQKELAHDWVFAGSSIFTDPITKKNYFGADDGDVITVSNFPTAILDLPISSTANDTERSFVANPNKVPLKGSKVTVYLSPLKS